MTIKRDDPTFAAFELNEYIQSFKTSSDRVRYVIFVVVAVSLLVLLSVWNYYPVSWSRQRNEDYEFLQRRVVDKEWLDARQEAAGLSVTPLPNTLPIDAWEANEGRGLDSENPGGAIPHTDALHPGARPRDGGAHQ